MIRARDGTGHFLHNKKVVTQGDTLEMIAYGMWILPLIQDLRTDNLRVTQSWYADDAGVGGNFATSVGI